MAGYSGYLAGCGRIERLSADILILQGILANGGSLAGNAVQACRITYIKCKIAAKKFCGKKMLSHS